ncbi:hypothetical protein ACHQM5_005655 [Ranunculus cassubicifolius]
MISPSKKRNWVLKPHTKTIPIPIQNPKNVEDRIGSSRSSQLGDSLQEAADRRRLKEATLFMEESLMEPRELLVQKITKLELELQSYQHNMGLLLIEKKNLESTFEEQRQSYIEIEERLKREKTARLMALSEIEKLTENLKVSQKGKQCISDVNMQNLHNQKEKALMEREKGLEKEWKVLHEEKEKLETTIISNKERLKNENYIAQEYIQKELESLRLKKASFEASMERERLVFTEKTRSERNQMLRDFERETQIRLEKMEHDHSRQYVEEQKLELQKEIDKLNTLVKKMKDQSGGVKEVLEKHVKCRKCGDDINFAISELQLLQDIQDLCDKAVEVPEVADEAVEVPEVADNAEEVPEALLCSELKTVPGKRGVKPKRGARACSVKKVSEDTGMDDKAVEGPEASLHSELKNLPRKRGARACSVKKVSEDTGMDDKAVEVPEAYLHSELKNLPRKRGARACSVKKVSEDTGMDEKAVEVPEASLQSELKNLPRKRGAQPKCGTKPKRGAQANSVKENVEEAKVESERILDQPIDVPACSNDCKEEDFVGVEKEPVGAVKGKRLYSNAVTSEEDQDTSVMKGVSKKRRQTVTQEPEVGGGRRYGLRQRKT